MRRFRLMPLLTMAGMMLAALSGVPAASASTGATTWIRAYVNPASVSPAAFGADVTPTTDGGYLVAGSTGGAAPGGWIGKVAASGALQWQEQVGCSTSSILSVQQTSDGGYVLAGGSNSCQKQCASGSSTFLACAWVLKISPAGAVQWQHIYPAAFQASASQVGQTSDGGYVVAGSTLDRAANNHAWIAKLTATGAVQWQRQIGSGSFADAQAVRQTADGGYVIAGGAGPFGKSSVLVVKLGSSGAIQWQRTYGTGNNDTASSVRQTTDGGYAVTGVVSPQGTPGTVRGAALLLKLTSAGAIQWQRRYDPGAGFGGSGASVRQTADGGYLLAGSIEFTVNGAPEIASWLAKTTSTGAISWQRDYYGINASTGLPYPSDFSAAAPAADGGYIAVGTTDKYHNSNDVWLVKTDASGNVAGCGKVHPAVSTALGAGLTAAPSALPEAAPAAAGAGVSGATTPATLTTVQAC